MKLTNEQIRHIQNRLKQPYWGIQTELAGEFNVSRTTIQRIQKGEIVPIEEIKQNFSLFDKLYTELKEEFRTGPCDIECDNDCKAGCHSTHYPHHKKPHPDFSCFV